MFDMKSAASQKRQQSLVSGQLEFEASDKDENNRN